MHSDTVGTKLLAALVAVTSLTATRASAVDALIPLSQDRRASTENVNAPQCSGDYLFDSDTAAGFEPFDAFVETEHSCDSGFAVATASQQSQIGGSSIVGSGSVTSEAAGPVPDVVHAFGVSYFEVTFDVLSTSVFTLDGVIDAGAVPDGSVGTLANIKLTGSGGGLIFDHTVQPAPDGTTTSQLINETGSLEPGSYVLQAQAGTFMKNDVPPYRTAQASFNFTFGASTLDEIPAVSRWGMIGLTFLLLSAGALVFSQRRRQEIAKRKLSLL